PDDLQPARFEAAQDGPDQSALDAIGLDDDQGAFLRHMPEGYRTSPIESGECCSSEIEGLFSLDAALYPSAVVSGRLSDQSGVNRGYRLLHEVQGPARDQERQADHDEEWSSRHRGGVPGLRNQDLQDRRWSEVGTSAGARGCLDGPYWFSPSRGSG